MPGEVVHLATPAVFGGRANIIASPFQWLFTGEDNLRLSVHNSLTGVSIITRLRFQPLVGPIQVQDHVMTPSSDRTQSTVDIKVGEGYLLNLACVASGASPLVGQTWVSARIMRGFTGATVFLGVLLAGYVTAQQPIAYPGTPIESSIAGGGYLRTVVGTAPAAGAQVNETVPTGARWELIGFRVTLQTDATVANRSPSLRLNSPSGDKSKTWQPTLIPASTNAILVWGQGLQQFTQPGGSFDQHAPLVQNAQLLAGDALLTDCANFQAGDRYIGPLLTVREWLEVS